MTTNPTSQPVSALEQLADFLPDGIVVVDEAGTIEYANETLAALTGYRTDELVGEPVEILVPMEARAAHRTFRSRFAASPSVRPMAGDLEIRCVRKDGSTFRADISLSPIATGTGMSTLAAVRHASARVEAEAALVEAERRWRSLLEQIQLVVVGLDADGRVSYANSSFLRLTGYQAAEVLGVDWFSTFLPASDAPVVRHVFDDVIAVSTPDTHVNRILTRDGEPRLIAWHNVRLLDTGGRPTGTMSIGDDITERTRADARIRAVNDVTSALLTGTDDDELMRLVTSWARRLVDADGAAVTLPHSETALRVAAADGHHAAQLRQLVFPNDESISGAVLRAGHAEMLDDASRDPRLFRPVVERGDVGPAVFVPLAVRNETSGTLTVFNCRGGRRFRAEDVELVRSFAQQASVAVEYTRAQRELRRFAVFEDRERIARDLHDRVIQQLFAVGMALQAGRIHAARTPELAERLAQAVEALDETIGDIRSVIFELHHGGKAGSLRAALLHLARETETRLGVRPRLRFAGEIDTLLSEAVGDHVLAVASEAISNAVRHGQARTIDVVVGITDGDVEVRVTDDGIGIPLERTRNSGLHNLAERARRMGGAFSVAPGPAGGTRLEWRVPLVA